MLAHLDPPPPPRQFSMGGVVWVETALPLGASGKRVDLATPPEEAARQELGLSGRWESMCCSLSRGLEFWEKRRRESCLAGVCWRRKEAKTVLLVL